MLLSSTYIQTTLTNALFLSKVSKNPNSKSEHPWHEKSNQKGQALFGTTQTYQMSFPPYCLIICPILKLVNNAINLNTVFFVVLSELLISGAFKLSTHIPPLGRGRSGYVTRKLPSSPVHRRFYAPEI